MALGEEEEEVETLLADARVLEDLVVVNALDVLNCSEEVPLLRDAPSTSYEELLEGSAVDRVCFVVLLSVLDISASAWELVFAVNNSEAVIAVALLDFDSK